MKMAITSGPVLNILFHNCLWLLCVIGRERLIWLSLPIAICYAFWLVYSDVVPARAIAIPFVLGISIDSILAWLNIFQFDNTFGLIPFWLTLLWLSFATTFSLSLKFLSTNWMFATAAGALAMPLNYLAGEKIGAVEFGVDPIFVCMLLAIVWGLLFPIIFRVLEFSGADHARV